MNFKKDFPMANKIIYFDSAALVLKPQIAIDAITNFYSNISISSRTADTPLGNVVNQAINEVRQKVANLIDAEESEIIFTSGTTESLNLAATMLCDFLQPDDEILLSAYNHASNMIPWHEISLKTKAKVIVAEDLEPLINSKTKIIALSQESNNFKVSYNLDSIYQKAEQVGALLINDAAQSIAHSKTSLKMSHLIAFSANKFYGPTGLGVLAIQKELLINLKPAKFGGGSISEIKKNLEWTKKDTISVFEPGTPDLAGLFMFNKSLDYFFSIGYEQTQKILNDLSVYLHQKLNSLDNIEVFSQPGDYIVLLNVKGINSQDVATYLGTKNIYTIAGIFCAHYLRNIKDTYSYLRISLGIYNTFEDIDMLVEALKNGGDFYAF